LNLVALQEHVKTAAKTGMIQFSIKEQWPLAALGKSKQVSIVLTLHTVEGVEWTLAGPAAAVGAALVPSMVAVGV